MGNLSALSIIINALTLSLALAFLIIILWFDIQKPLIQSFAVFLLTVTFWNGASLLSEISLLIDPDNSIVVLFMVISDIGFASACVALYVFATALMGTHSRFFRILAFASLTLVVLNNLVVLQDLLSEPTIQVPFRGVSALYFLLFDLVAAYLIVRYQKKIRSRNLIIGLLIFILGQGLSFLNPALGIASLGVLVSAVATLIVSFAMVQMELISPLQERISQVETMHQISLSIVKWNQLNKVVSEVTREVVNWLEANAAIVYLLNSSQDHLQVASTFEIPERLVIQSEIPVDFGIAGETILRREPILIENYARDWSGDEEFYLARETVGSLMSVPLFANEKILGVVLVIAGRHGKLFDDRDLGLLKQLSDQIAVAISHSQLFEDVTSAHMQLQTVLTSTENPVIAVSRDLKIVFSNPSANSILNFSSSNRNRSVNSIPRSLLPANIRELLRKLRSDGYFTYELEYESRIYLCHVAPLGSSHIDGWVAVLNDITDLMELDRMKSEMVRMTSHDLKNPLQAAMANLELLREDIDTDNSEALLSITTIEKQLNKMHRIISGILDLERIKLGSLAKEILRAEDLLNQVYEELEDYAVDNKILLHCNIGSLHEVMIAGDFNQLKRALVNLVENAIKFTDKGGNVWFSGRCQNNNLVIEVKDSGIGIPKELHEKIFDRFFRGQQENFAHVSGSGLGLSFVKSIVEKHSGKIDLISEVGHGSCFTISLPLV